MKDSIVQIKRDFIKYSTLVFLILILDLFVFCKKDWGTSQKELYDSVEGPVAGTEKVIKKIEVISQKNEIKYGEKCRISVNVSEIQINEYGDTVSINLCPPGNLYYVWKFSDTGLGGSYYFSYTYCGFRIDNKYGTSGYGLGNVTLSAPEYDSISLGYRNILNQVKIVLLECRIQDSPDDENYYSKSISLKLK